MNECMFFGTYWGQNNFLSSTASTNVWMTSITSMAKLDIILVGGFKDILLRIDNMESSCRSHVTNDVDKTRTWWLFCFLSSNLIHVFSSIFFIALKILIFLEDKADFSVEFFPLVFRYGLYKLDIYYIVYIIVYII